MALSVVATDSGKAEELAQNSVTTVMPLAPKPSIVVNAPGSSPRASTDTCAPPPVASRTAPTVARPSAAAAERSGNPVAR